MTHDVAELAVSLLDLPVVVLLLLLQTRNVLAERGLERLVSAVNRRARLFDKPVVSSNPKSLQQSKVAEHAQTSRVATSPEPVDEKHPHLADSTVQLSLSLGHTGQFPHGELEDLLLLLLLLDLRADDGALALAVDGLRLDLLQDLVASASSSQKFSLPYAACRRRGWTSSVMVQNA